MMVFDHYEDVPKSVQEEIIKKVVKTYRLAKSFPPMRKSFLTSKRAF